MAAVAESQPKVSAATFIQGVVKRVRKQGKQLRFVDIKLMSPGVDDQSDDIVVQAKFNRENMVNDDVFAESLRFLKPNTSHRLLGQFEVNLNGSTKLFIVKESSVLRFTHGVAPSLIWQLLEDLAGKMITTSKASALLGTDRTLLDEVLKRDKSSRKSWCSKKAREISTGRCHRGRRRAPRVVKVDKELLRVYEDRDVFLEELVVDGNWVDGKSKGSPRSLGKVDPAFNLTAINDASAATRLQYLTSKKRPQVRTMMKLVEQLIKNGGGTDVATKEIIDVGGGRGDLALALSMEYPSVKITVYEPNKPSCDVGQHRANELGISNISFECHALDVLSAKLSKAEVTASPPLIISLHACGGLSDAILSMCGVFNLPFCLCTCCFASFPQLRPKALCEQDKDFIKLSHLAETNELDDDTRHLATRILNNLRLKTYFKNRFDGGVLSSDAAGCFQMYRFPKEWSPRNFILTGQAFYPGSSAVQVPKPDLSTIDARCFYPQSARHALSSAGNEHVTKRVATTKEFTDLKEKLRKKRRSESRAQSTTAMPNAYPKQQLAFDAADKYNQALGDEASEDKQQRVFSIELSNTGKRSFIACTLDTFWNAYLCLAPRRRNYYEIIRQHHPCRLYFDCEFYKEYNPHLSVEEDGPGMIDELVRLTASVLQVRYGIMVARDSFLILDSSTDSKCSYHIIVHLPDGQLFRSNIDVGNFVVHHLAHSCRPSSSVPEKKLYSRLWVRGRKEGELEFFADLAVYTKNRAFRLLYSSKFGKVAPLLPSNLNKFPFDAFDGEYQLFKDSLISSSSVHAKQVASRQGRADGAELPKVLVVPSPANTSLVPLPHKISVVPSTHHVNDVTYNSTIIKDASTAQQRTLGNIVEFLTQIQHVAIPSDAVVQRASSSFMIATRSRACRIAGRQHRSNHIFFIVDTVNKSVIQCCHDDECRQKNSVSVSLPPELFEEDGESARGRGASLDD